MVSRNCSCGLFITAHGRSKMVRCCWSNVYHRCENEKCAQKRIRCQHHVHVKLSSIHHTQFLQQKVSLASPRPRSRERWTHAILLSMKESSHFRYFPSSDSPVNRRKTTVRRPGTVRNADQTMSASVTCVRTSTYNVEDKSRHFRCLLIQPSLNCCNYVSLLFSFSSWGRAQH